jgi:hypothetical protein
MKKFAMILLAAVSLSAFAADTAVKGHLVDLSCAAEDANKPGFGEKHSKGCLQMPDCVKSGYGVLTADRKVIKFDAAGNEKAIKFIDSLQQKKDIKVTVTGAVDGDKITVAKIELQ